MPLLDAEPRDERVALASRKDLMVSLLFLRLGGVFRLCRLLPIALLGYTSCPHTHISVTSYPIFSRDLEVDLEVENVLILMR